MICPIATPSTRSDFITAHRRTLGDASPTSQSEEDRWCFDYGRSMHMSMSPVFEFRSQPISCLGEAVTCQDEVIALCWLSLKRYWSTIGLGTSADMDHPKTLDWHRCTMYICLQSFVRCFKAQIDGFVDFEDACCDFTAET